MPHRSALLRRVLGPLVAVVLLGSASAAVAGPASHETDDVPPLDSASWLVQPAGEHGGADVRAFLEHDAAPGEVIQDAISITNHAETDVTLRLLATDAFSDPETGAFSLLPSDTDPQDLGAWVTLPADEVTVPARAQAQVPVAISVPDNATPGDHAGGIITSFVGRSQDEDGQPVLVEARIAMRVYLSVDGEREPALVIEDLESSFALGSDQVRGTLTVRYVVTNAGNTRLGVAESLRAAGPFGVFARDVEAVGIDELLPGQSVHREVTVEGLPAAFRVSTDVTLRAVDLGDPDRALDAVTAGVSTAAMSWVPFAVLALIALFVWGGVRRRRRWRALRAEVQQARSARRDPGDGDAPPSGSGTVRA